MLGDIQPSDESDSLQDEEDGDTDVVNDKDENQMEH